MSSWDKLKQYAYSKNYKMGSSVLILERAHDSEYLTSKKPVQYFFFYVMGITTKKQTGKHRSNVQLEAERKFENDIRCEL